MPFHCKQFSIEQSDNLQKIGSDSMLLGAWTKGYFSTILDIGTGTGILALIQAQQNQLAQIIGIEPHEASYLEAELNFKSSPFSNRMTCIKTKLQSFKTDIKFDLIIANPPYFDQDYLSANAEKNSARHTVDLSISDLYFHVSKLLSEEGKFHVVFPYSVAEKHIRIAAGQGLYPYKKLIATSENKTPIRYFIGFQKRIEKCISEDIIIKYNDGMYSKKYAALTSDYYNRILNAR